MIDHKDPISMKQERAFIMIKPDGVARGLVGEIIQRFERTGGLKLTALKMFYPDYEQSCKHYDNSDAWKIKLGTRTKDAQKAQGREDPRDPIEIGNDIQEKLRNYLCQGPVVAMIWQGNQANQLCRKITGHTCPRDAAPGTVRGDLSVDDYDLSDASNRPMYNLLHCSDSPENAELEIKRWFKEDEIHAWQKLDEARLYEIWKSN
ncbi:MAG: nucleoside-diphosphate kinase [Patescibacteria group bacterium]|nr:nucleoside-diphosphate kinase [Patescibacteria group bacterium]